MSNTFVRPNDAAPCGSWLRNTGLFHQTIPPGPLIHGLKPFCIWVRIREVIRQSRCLSGVNVNVNYIGKL
jgi:hypothetical protein